MYFDFLNGTQTFSVSLLSRNYVGSYILLEDCHDDSNAVYSTGTTGYIGGTVLDTIVTKHPEYEITVLLRNVPSDFASRYPKVSIVRGDYDNIDIIADTASNAKIVVRK